VVATAFAVVLVGEFGDLTQLLTVNMVAHYHQPWSVFVGALLALMAAAALGAFGGRALLRVLPLARIRRIGGVVLLGFAAYNLYSLLA
jgi:putative Ca2+/H+ antiporter (TMEM165/GDT1 family)